MDLFCVMQKTAVVVGVGGWGSGVCSSELYALDPPAPAGPALTAPTEGAVLSDTTPTVTGTGEPGAEVEVKVDGIPIGTAPVGVDGSWSLPLTDPLSDGSHNITAEQTDEAGNTSDPAMVTVTVDATAPAAPATWAPLSEERRVGKAGVSTVRTRGAP